MVAVVADSVEDADAVVHAFEDVDVEVCEHEKVC